MNIFELEKVIPATEPVRMWKGVIATPDGRFFSKAHPGVERHEWKLGETSSIPLSQTVSACVSGFHGCPTLVDIPDQLWNADYECEIRGTNDQIALMLVEAWGDSSYETDYYDENKVQKLAVRHVRVLAVAVLPFKEATEQFIGIGHRGIFRDYLANADEEGIISLAREQGLVAPEFVDVG